MPIDFGANSAEDLLFSGITAAIRALLRGSALGESQCFDYDAAKQGLGDSVNALTHLGEDEVRRLQLDLRTQFHHSIIGNTEEIHGAGRIAEQASKQLFTPQSHASPSGGNQRRST